MADAPIQKGIYSSSHTARIGTGMTRRATTIKRFWAVQEEDDGSYTILPLNQNLIPTGQKRPILPDELAAGFTYEPEFFVEPIARPVWRPEDETLKPGAGAAHAARAPRKVAPDRTELEDDDERAAKMQQRHAELLKKRMEAEEQTERKARAEFVLGVSHLRRGERNKALQLFEKIATMDGTFAPRHKHMFNEFGIGLRKSNLPEMALKMYRRTLELSPNDDHIYHNMARIHYERGEVIKAIEMLQKSLEINPGLEMSRKFLDFIDKNRKKFPKFSI
ncbi:tetratricopeptide repeat protein [Megalodesulfovibrio paquesii]